MPRDPAVDRDVVGVAVGAVGAEGEDKGRFEVAEEAVDARGLSAVEAEVAVGQAPELRLSAQRMRQDSASSASRASATASLVAGPPSWRWPRSP